MEKDLRNENMEQLFNQQFILFENVLERKLTDDEKYLIKNAFQNGVEQGEEKCKNDVLEIIKRMI